MVGHGGSSAGSYFADPTSPIPFHCASTVATSTLRVNKQDCPMPSHQNAVSIIYSCCACFKSGTEDSAGSQKQLSHYARYTVEMSEVPSIFLITLSIQLLLNSSSNVTTNSIRYYHKTIHLEILLSIAPVICDIDTYRLNKPLQNSSLCSSY